MTHNLIFALAQCNFIVGDITGNIAKITDYYKRAVEQKADMVIFSELAITGYPPEDLVLRSGFQRTAMAALHPLMELTKESPTAMLVGGIACEDEAVANAAFLIRKGEVTAIIKKSVLPNYGVFDEMRVFIPHSPTAPIAFKRTKLGVVICEDLWRGDSVDWIADHHAKLLIVLNASPFERNKHEQRLAVARRQAEDHQLPLIYVNQVGGQDELVFDGGSFVMDKTGAIALQAPFFEESLNIINFERHEDALVPVKQPIAEVPNEREFVYQALMMGLRDYITKNNFPGVVLGLSGGIDSALTAAIAVDALGADKVQCVMLPSRYTSQESLNEARECASRLGVKLDTVLIESIALETHEMLKSMFAKTKPDLTEENMQSRIRGMILMAISNKFGKMVLTTGNKSEMAVGYATIYGDMCGGFNVLKDIYKSEVWAIARWRNRYFPQNALGKNGAVIPDSTINRPPTAELRDNQTDQQTLPTYEFLDDILFKFIEQSLPVDVIVQAGYKRETVEQIVHLVYQNEYKRRQAAPGVKISSLSFGKERRYPMTNKYRW